MGSAAEAAAVPQAPLGPDPGSATPAPSRAEAIWRSLKASPFPPRPPHCASAPAAPAPGSETQASSTPLPSSGAAGCSSPAAPSSAAPSLDDVLHGRAKLPGRRPKDPKAMLFAGPLSWIQAAPSGAHAEVADVAPDGGEGAAPASEQARGDGATDAAAADVAPNRGEGATEAQALGPLQGLSPSTQGTPPSQGAGTSPSEGAGPEAPAAGEAGPQQEEAPSLDTSAAASALAAARAAASLVVDTSSKVEVKEVMDFAGQSVEVSRFVESESKAAKAAKRKAEMQAASSRGLDALLAQIEKKKKLNILDKTRKDWGEYKAGAGVEQELEEYKRSGATFTEKAAFLNRADVREYEKERDLRLTAARPGPPTGSRA